MLTTRELPSSEWHRLSETSFRDLWPLLPPSPNVRVLVVEDESGAILGCWGLLQLWHLEGLWMAPGAPRASVGRRLLTMMRQWLREAGLSAVLTGSLEPSVDRMLSKVGAYPMPGKAFVWPQAQEQKTCH